MYWNDWKNYREEIRRIYKEYEKKIISREITSPYSLGIDFEFSPIERSVWEDIRYLGLPLFPQYPIGPYFADFADPKRKIAIEVDSIQFHKDKKKDADRQRQIQRLGWKVYRIPSWMTFRNTEENPTEPIQSSTGSFLDFETAEEYLAYIYSDYLKDRRNGESDND